MKIPCRIASPDLTAGDLSAAPFPALAVAGDGSVSISIRKDGPTLAIAYLPPVGLQYELRVECAEAGHVLTFVTDIYDLAGQQWIGPIDHGPTEARTTLRVHLRRRDGRASGMTAQVAQLPNAVTVSWIADEHRDAEAVGTLLLVTRPFNHR